MSVNKNDGISDSTADRIEALRNNSALTKKEKIIRVVSFLIEDYRNNGIGSVTLRQIYYRLVSLGWLIKNNLGEYKRLSRILVDARENGRIPSDIFEDRARFWRNYGGRYISPEEYFVSALKKFASSADSYRLPKWTDQPYFPFISLEKMALRSVFEPVCSDLRVPLIINSGYNSYTQVREFSSMLKRILNGRKPIMLYFGDYDPSGEDIMRNLLKYLARFGIEPEWEKVALTEEQILKYRLPRAPPKKSDPRTGSWSGGDTAELDALSPPVLIDLIKKSVYKYFDWDIYAEVSNREYSIRKNLRDLIYGSLFLGEIPEELKDEIRDMLMDDDYPITDDF